MDKLKTVLKYIGIVSLFFILGILLYLHLMSPGSTPAFKNNQGDIVKNSISEMKYITIDGIEQFVLIRGQNISNPILLILHGGPGNPELPMYRKFNKELEEHFTVVYWDQRGCGKSTDENIPEDSFTLDQFVEDTHEVTIYLKTRFNKSKIYLLGHSWGSLLGISTAYKYPSDYIAYIGTGQVADMRKNERLAYDFAVKKAKEVNDSIAIYDLNEIGSFTDIDLNEDYLNSRSYVSVFGGMLYEENNPIDIFVLPLLYCKEYTISDKKAFIMGGTSPTAIIQSPSFGLLKRIMATDLTKTITELKLPVYFLQGKYDFLTNYSVAKEYFDSLKAPKKEFITFNKSAHFVPFEQPKKFNMLMINKILKETTEYNTK